MPVGVLPERILHPAVVIRDFNALREFAVPGFQFVFGLSQQRIVDVETAARFKVPCWDTLVGEAVQIVERLGVRDPDRATLGGIGIYVVVVCKIRRILQIAEIGEPVTRATG